MGFQSALVDVEDDKLNQLLNFMFTVVYFSDKGGVNINIVYIDERSNNYQSNTIRHQLGY